MSRFGRWKFWGKKEKSLGNESQDIKEMERNVSKNIKYLHKCADYTSSKALEAFEKLTEVRFACMGQPEKEEVIAACAVDKHYAELFTKMWESLTSSMALQHVDGFENHITMLSTYVCFTNASSNFSSELGKTDCIPILIGVLDKMQQDLMSDGIFLQCTFSLLVNIVQYCTDNIRVFRRINTVPVLKTFLHQENQVVQIMALFLLAFIADDTEIGLLQTVDGAVVRLVSMIKDANEDDDHKVNEEGGTVSQAVSALQLLEGLNKLAVNDANKVEIVNHGGIQVFIRMLQDDFSEDEHIAAVKALWNLSFIEELRKSTELQESIKSLERLVISSNPELQHVCTYAMWEIKGRISTGQLDSRSPPTYEESISQPNQQLLVDKPPTHLTTQIMLSYQWDNQEETLKIRDKLTEAGHKVWMDVTHMKADYAFQLKKTVIPLRMDEEYLPDGWLGMFVSGKLYHKCYSVDQIDSSMEGLLKDIDNAFGTSDVDDEVDGPVNPTEQEVLNSSASACQKEPEPEPVSGQEKTPATQWSREDVQAWLKDNDLTELCETFKRYRGRHLEEMYTSLSRDETAFSDSLKSVHRIDNAQLRFEFVVELKEAFKTK